MLRHHKIILLIFIALSLTFAFAEFNPNTMEQKNAVLKTQSLVLNPDEFEVLFENDNFVFSYKEGRDVLKIYDKRNAYSWLSGLDIAPSKAVKAALRNKEPLGYEPLESKLNEIFTSLANALITIEYYDDSLGIKRLSSDLNSELVQVSGEKNHYILEIAFDEIDLQMKVHLIFTEDGYDVEIKASEISGEGRGVLAAVMLNPFLGASGGMYALYDEETGKHGDPIKKPEIPGYVLVPDGPGALIDFADYNVSMKPYDARVYGDNLAKMTYNRHETLGESVPLKEPTMPVYGIAHTKEGAAFLGYASSGDAFMDIIVMPEENTTLYTWAYPRFEFNSTFYQIFNKKGEGYFTLAENMNQFDINFHYVFLYNAADESESADYVGMAKKYRKYLETADLLPNNTNPLSLPIRLDFIMSDQKKSVIGYENAVVTKIEDVEKILMDLKASGIDNISSGLLGWQDGGVTIGKPWETDWDSEIGSKRDFQSVVRDLNEQGIPISMSQDYFNIAKDQVKANGNAVKHINNWYIERFLYTDVPFNEFYYAIPSKSVAWLKEQTDALMDIGIKSHTIRGITSNLTTSHGRDSLTEKDVMDMYVTALSSLQKNLKLNLESPNQYLWAFTSKYLQTPIASSQYLIETETVPFLQLVLSGSMEMYAPYSNFSFSEQKDILKMIDFNVLPSFILSKEAAYYLSTTNSLDLYSTEYSQYKDVILKVYNITKDAMEPVLNAEWLTRKVLENGLIENRYDNGVQILINYTKVSKEFKGNTILPLSYAVIGAEVGHE